jgi:DNA-binding XRE family transcriptional regulator
MTDPNIPTADGTTDRLRANGGLVEALSALYPDLSPTQVLTLATDVDRLARRAVREVPWLTATLKLARCRAGLRQADVAAAMDWSPSKVIRIENGTTGISHTDLTALIGLYRIADGETVSRLLEEAKARRHANRRPPSAPVPAGGRDDV